MRTALISDIHGNLEALEAVLAAIDGERVDRVVCLGDIVGYGADPLACCERIRERCGHVILGNRDLCVDQVGGGFPGGTDPARSWTLAQLSANDVSWLKSRPAQATLYQTPEQRDLLEAYEQGDERAFDLLQDLSREQPCGGPLSAVHASFEAGWHVHKYILDVEAARLSFADQPLELGVAGHSHIPSLIVEADLVDPAVDGSYEAAKALFLERHQIPFVDGPRQTRPLPSRKALINPGSVGQQRNGDARACFAILDSDAGVVSWIRVPYDVDSAARKVRASGAPDWYISRLYTGR